MISHKYKKPNKPSQQNLLKLPQIPSRKQVQSAKKNPPLVPYLPKIDAKYNHSDFYVDKQNISLNLIPKRNSFDKEIKARLFEVEAADKMVKNILGGPQATISLGGDMTNFQHKIQVNRKLIRKQRKRSHFQQHDPSQPQQLYHEDSESLKLKRASSNELIPKLSKPASIQHQMKIKIQQNNEAQTLRQMKKGKKSQNQDLKKLRYKSERKVKNIEKNTLDENSQVFRSIRQILSDPQKNYLDIEAKNVKKIVKFTIEQLENKLKKMKRFQSNRSYFQGCLNTNGSNIFDRKLNSAKSVGMIPIGLPPVVDDYTFKNWNRVEFREQGKGRDNQNKIVRYHKSDFEQEVEHIQRLQMKSYKSIQKMVQNRKLLVDLKLMNGKNKSSLISKQKNSKQISI